MGFRGSRPLVQVTDPRRPEFEFGPITVTAPKGGNRDVSFFQAEGPIAAPPEDVEAALLDYDAWTSSYRLATPESRQNGPRRRISLARALCCGRTRG